MAHFHPGGTRRIVTMLILALLGAPVAGLASTPVATQVDTVTFAGAGDIATCDSDTDEATARLLDDIDGAVFALGDTVGDHGTPGEFAACYDPTWGRHRDRTHPVPGNHDYRIPRALGYFGYFGDRAGDPDGGWYAFDLGDWHVVALNSNCDEIGGCGEGSDQLDWLREDLAANPARCTIAMMHHPRFSSTGSTHDQDLGPIWTALHDAGVEIVLSGHAHIYERFAPQDPAGNLDPEGGVRQFVVGTGGAPLHDIEDIRPHSEVRNAERHGVLKLTLHDDRYDWTFVPVDGADVTDSGSADCH